MILNVYTARLRRGFADPDLLNITRRTGGEAGDPFAPSWGLLMPALRARREAQALRADASATENLQRAGGGAREACPDCLAVVGSVGCCVYVARAKAERIEEDAWLAYVPAFRGEMLVSYGVAPGSMAHANMSADAAIHVDRAWARGRRPKPDAWRAVLARERVVLGCVCPDRERCHRGLVMGFLIRLGAVDGGEIV